MNVSCWHIMPTLIQTSSQLLKAEYGKLFHNGPAGRKPWTHNTNVWATYGKPHHKKILFIRALPLWGITPLGGWLCNYALPWDPVSSEADEVASVVASPLWERCRIPQAEGGPDWCKWRRAWRSSILGYGVWMGSLNLLQRSHPNTASKNVRSSKWYSVWTGSSEIRTEIDGSSGPRHDLKDVFSRCVFDLFFLKHRICFVLRHCDAVLLSTKCISWMMEAFKKCISVTT